MPSTAAAIRASASLRFSFQNRFGWRSSARSASRRLNHPRSPFGLAAPSPPPTPPSPLPAPLPAPLLSPAPLPLPAPSLLPGPLPSGIRGSAPLGLFDDAVEEGLDRPLGDEHHERADQRQRRRRPHGVDDPGPAVGAGGHFDRADVVAQRRPGEQLVGEAGRRLVGDHLLAQRRPDRAEQADRAEAVGRRLALALERRPAQRRDRGVAAGGGEDRAERLPRGPGPAAVGGGAHPPEGEPTH